MPGTRGGSQAAGTAPPALRHAGRGESTPEATVETTPPGTALLEAGPGRGARLGLRLPRPPAP